MISRKNRFHGYNSLKSVYYRAQTVRDNTISIKFVGSQKRSDSRIAVVVSKKLHKSAVKRNRIRRRIFEVIRLNLPNFNNCYDIIITVFDDSIVDAPSSALTKSIENLLKKANII